MKSRQPDKGLSQAIAGVAHESIQQSLAARIDRRNAERVPLRVYVSYFTDEWMGLSRGQGWLVDLSKTGCKILGPALMVETSVTLVFYFQDENDPLCVSNTTVTWSDGETFGVRFPKLKAQERQRVQELVLKYATFPARSREHTAFRLA
ncbi:MAG TPA: PilZ domain-containing protein [Nitrospira sp.]|nr:PilZ domain-containing protein [Nitrospira sp.]